MDHNDIKFGNRLVRARRERKIHIAQAAKDLCIPQRYLAAFEKNDLKALPEPIYAVGFMRTYADYLGLNPGPLVENLKANYNSLPPALQAGNAGSSSGSTIMGVLLFLAVAGSLGFFGLKSVAEPRYEVQNADEIPDHVATLLESENNQGVSENEEADTP